MGVVTPWAGLTRRERQRLRRETGTEAPGGGPASPLVGTYTEVSERDTSTRLLSALLTGRDGRVALGTMEEYAAIIELLGRGPLQLEGKLPGGLGKLPARAEDVPSRNEEVARVNTMYKPVAKKVRPVATGLPSDSAERVSRAREEQVGKGRAAIGHVFTPETLGSIQVGGGSFLTGAEERVFRQIVEGHGRAFAFCDEERGSVDPRVVAPMIIFTVPHVPWKLRPIPVPRAHYEKLMDLLRARIKSGILEPSSGPYASRWFTVPKKDGGIRFIQDCQPLNAVTIRNSCVAPMIQDFIDRFAGRSIYSMTDLYSGYDQFPLSESSRDLTALQTPLGLLRMTTVPQGGTNSVGHVVHGVNEVFREFIPNITLPFIDDMPIRGSGQEERDAREESPGVRRFVADHARDVDRILSRAEEVGLTFSGKKSAFGVREIKLLGYVCDWRGKRPDPDKVPAIERMKDCQNVTEVRRFLGALGFFRMFISRFAELADPLYALLRKGAEWEWTEECHSAMANLKAALANAPVLRPLVYGPTANDIYLTVDAGPTGIGWMLGQEDSEGVRLPAKFGAKTLSEPQRAYGQTKRELFGLRTALREERESILGAKVVVETDCKPLLGMLANCDTPDLTSRRWVAEIKEYDVVLRHIKGKDNEVADMLSRATYEGTDASVLVNAGRADPGVRFKEGEYSGSELEIGKYLAAIANGGSSGGVDPRLRRRAGGYLVRDGYLWKRPLPGQDRQPRRVVGTEGDRLRVMRGVHEDAAAGHRGVERTYLRARDLYHWPGMRRDIRRYVETCPVCQEFSSKRYYEELHPEYPPAILFSWSIDVVKFPRVEGYHAAVIAREGLTNFVEGRALTNTKTATICRFVLEEIICRYGCCDRMRADNGELGSSEARAFFERYRIKLRLTTTYNPEANGRVERGHQPLVGALAKAAEGRIADWPALFPLALWADRTTVSRSTGFAPAQLMYGERLRLPVEDDVVTWIGIDWRDGIDREELLGLRIRQLERREEDLKKAQEHMGRYRGRMKEEADKRRPLRPRALTEGDWVLVKNSRLENQFVAERKFEKKWTGPYVVVEVFPDTGTYSLRELDGTPLRRRVAGKRVKLFKRRDGTAYEVDRSLEEEEDVRQGVEAAARELEELFRAERREREGLVDEPWAGGL